MALTPNQKKILEYLEDYTRGNGFAPTQQEIASRFKLKSLGSVQDYLKSMEAKGYLSKDWNGRRAIRLHQMKANALRLPLLGTVAAGTPIEAIENPETVEFPASLLEGGENFALRVKGDSMIEEGINSGDLVIVRKQATAEKGQTIVAKIDGEATVKKYFPRKDSIELRPANARMEPIMVKAGQDFQILGIVVGLIRKYG